LLTTHDLGEAVDICDQVSVLRSGRIVADVMPVEQAALDSALRSPAP